MQKTFTLLLLIYLCGFSTVAKAAEYWAIGTADEANGALIFTISTNDIEAGVSAGPYSNAIQARQACEEFFLGYQKEDMYGIKLVNKCTEIIKTK